VHVGIIYENCSGCHPRRIGTPSAGSDEALKCLFLKKTSIDFFGK
jgi:hypothetical protein